MKDLWKILLNIYRILSVGSTPKQLQTARQNFRNRGKLKVKKNSKPPQPPLQDFSSQSEFTAHNIEFLISLIDINEKIIKLNSKCECTNNENVDQNNLGGKLNKLEECEESIIHIKYDEDIDKIDSVSFLPQACSNCFESWKTFCSMLNSDFLKKIYEIFGTFVKPEIDVIFVFKILKIIADDDLKAFMEKKKQYKINIKAFNYYLIFIKKLCSSCFNTDYQSACESLLKESIILRYLFFETDSSENYLLKISIECPYFFNIGKLNKEQTLFLFQEMIRDGIKKIQDQKFDIENHYFFFMQIFKLEFNHSEGSKFLISQFESNIKNESVSNYLIKIVKLLSKFDRIYNHTLKSHKTIKNSIKFGAFSSVFASIENYQLNDEDIHTYILKPQENDTKLARLCLFYKNLTNERKVEILKCIFGSAKCAKQFLLTNFYLLGQFGNFTLNYFMEKTIFNFQYLEKAINKNKSKPKEFIPQINEEKLDSLRAEFEKDFFPVEDLKTGQIITDVYGFKIEKIKKKDNQKKIRKEVSLNHVYRSNLLLGIHLLTKNFDKYQSDTQLLKILNEIKKLESCENKSATQIDEDLMDKLINQKYIYFLVLACLNKKRSAEKQIDSLVSIIIPNIYLSFTLIISYLELLDGFSMAVFNLIEIISRSKNFDKKNLEYFASNTLKKIFTQEDLIKLIKETFDICLDKSFEIQIGIINLINHFIVNHKDTIEIKTIESIKNLLINNKYKHSFLWCVFVRIFQEYNSIQNGVFDNEDVAFNTEEFKNQLNGSDFCNVNECLKVLEEIRKWKIENSILHAISGKIVLKIIVFHAITNLELYSTVIESIKMTFEKPLNYDLLNPQITSYFRQYGFYYHNKYQKSAILLFEKLKKALESPANK